MLKKKIVFWFVLVFFSITVPIFALEVGLRFLPVCEGTYRLPVNDENPILRFQPNRDLVWSKGWNFEISNEVKINNFGFVSNVDYVENGKESLLAIIGDSYVEALMVPFRETVAGRLNEYLGESARVYSFGVSGAPLSQYLAYSQYVRDKFHPDAMAMVIIGNDFDESLLKYNVKPGFHHFSENSLGGLHLKRVDYEPSLILSLARKSALARYLVINLEWGRRVNQLSNIGIKEHVQYVGNTSSVSDFTRVADSKNAVDAFLENLPKFSGLEPHQLLFMVDGMRPHLYEVDDLQLARGSFVDGMRMYFMKKASAMGYEIIDMQPVFINHFKEYGKRFEYPSDGHWNSLGHEQSFDAIVRSGFLSRSLTEFVQ